MYTFVIYTI